MKDLGPMMKVKPIRTTKNDLIYCHKYMPIASFKYQRFFSWKI